eukprot:TRINITY_DN7490_c0_g1_i1.p1 TRINITY_DN7490_c0_g1~~TRINITY_DN7490_c0_g1_i1.p1  ORF type:complete len:459 (+),score=54.37 TRINITY_DN7490_c0_g1_i1:288-1664(+)
MGRFWEGTGLLHQMRGEWFDSISCCVTFSMAARKAKPKDVERFRHVLIRLMSLCHGSALEEIACQNPGTLASIDPYGLSNSTLCHLSDCTENHGFNRVEVLLHLIQSLITTNLDEGVLKIPPPILSRVYQTLSRGFVNLLNAKKIADTRFPFPLAQLIAYSLILNTVLTPLVISSLFESLVWAPMFSFLPLFVMASLNSIGTELENPFGSDDNDLPMDHFQDEMNVCLMTLLHHNTDIVPSLSEERCCKDFYRLEAMMVDAHDSSEDSATKLSLVGFHPTKADRVSARATTRVNEIRMSSFHVAEVAPAEASLTSAVSAPPAPPAPPPPAHQASLPCPGKIEESEAMVLNEFSSMLKDFLHSFRESQDAWLTSMNNHLKSVSSTSLKTSQTLRDLTEAFKVDARDRVPRRNPVSGVEVAACLGATTSPCVDNSEMEKISKRSQKAISDIGGHFSKKAS